MSDPSLTISSTAFSGYFRIDLTSAGLPSAPKQLFAITNENSVTSPIVETLFPVVDSNQAIVSSINLDSTVIPLGKTTLVFLRYVFSNNDFLDSNVLVVTNKSVASTPVLTVPSVVRPEDQGISINIGSLYTPSSVSDGFSPITKAIVYISKVGGTVAGDLMVRMVQISDYNAWYPVGATDLTNAQQYEVAFKVVNGVAISPVSNTITIAPLDTASQMDAPTPVSLLSYQSSKNQTLNDSNGDIVVFFNRNADYNSLIGNSRRVLKYKLYEQEYIDVTADNVTTTQPSGTPTLYELTVPSHLVGDPSGASFELTTEETFESSSYKYKYIIPGSVSRIGKKFKYSITATNINGDGPISIPSLFCFSIKAPEKQTFTLNHTNTVSNVTATPLTIYSGKMTINLATLSGVNGGVVDTVLNTYATDVKMKLQVVKESDQSVMFNGVVTLVQNVNTVTTGVGLDQVTTNTPAGTYVLDFDNIDTSGDIGVQNLNLALANGTKYRFSLYRTNKDPVRLQYLFSSQTTDILRTKFASPEAINEIQSYGIYDNFMPVSTSTVPTLRLVFNQLPINRMNGMNVFNSEISYRPFQNSLPITGISAITHDSNITTSREFIITQQNFGGSSSNYIRTTCWNPELSVYIDAVESAPAVTETAFFYPASASNLVITKNNSTAITISFTKQSGTVSSLMGSSTSNIQNRVIVMEDGVAVQKHEAVIAWSAGSQQTIVSNLTAGKTYVIFVIAERLYIKAGLTVNEPKRFENVVIRNNYIKQSLVMCASPSVPQNVEILPSNSKLTILYDQPATLSGIDVSSLRYHFYCNKDNTDFPTSNVSVADVSGSSQALLTQVFTTKLLASSRTNLTPIINDTLYHFAMRAVATVGGNSLLQTFYSLNTNGLFNAVPATNLISLSTDLTVPQEEVLGNMYVHSSTVMTGEGTPLPTGVSVSPQDSTLTVLIKKDTTGSTNDMYITLNKNDALNNSANPVDAFDTRPLATTSGGLFNLETFLGNNSIPIDYQKYNFKRLIINSETYYQLEFINLVNGQIYDVDVRFIRNLGSGIYIFSESVLISRAPEAPPTVVRNPSFSVASQSINVSWSAPLNSGGAAIGGNGSLKYKVQLLSSTDSILSTYETTLTNFTVPNLTNETSYKVRIAGFYIKSSDSSEVVGTYVSANTLGGGIIVPNVAPVGSTITSVTNGNNTISGAIVTAAGTEQGLYPLNAIQVWIRDKNTPANRVCVQSFAGPFSGTNTSNFTTNSFSSPVPDTASTIGHAKPLNGYAYEVVIVHVANYTDAQSPPDKTSDVMPFGPVIITNMAIKTGTNSKVMTVTANLNGTGAINNVIGLAKSSSSSTIVVNNLSGGSLPTITMSGALDNTNGPNGTNGYVAANQTATFDLSFVALSGAVNDLLTVVVTQNGSDSATYPTTGSFFG